jgi:uncharacterized protein YkwD
MLTRRLPATAIAAAAAASIALSAAASTGAFAASEQHHRHAHHTHRGSQVRTYDTHLLAHANGARSSYNDRGYTMNHKLWKVAHAWAEHMARTGRLEHNPSLESKISNKCPAWRNIGENVGVVYGSSVRQLFHAYMHSPDHRANILDHHYRQVGIATVKVVHHGHVQEWDVMDFGNHC